EMVKESINNEYNRIRKNIVESPYSIQDIGIQVAVDSRKDQLDDEGNPQYLSVMEQETVRESIASILDSIITTSISSDVEEEIDTADKVSIVFEEFQQQPSLEIQSEPAAIPTWLYIVIGALALLIILLLVLMLRKRKTDEVIVEELTEAEEPVDRNIPDLTEEIDTEEKIKMKQLEAMAKEKPEDFAKLLRTWISED